MPSPAPELLDVLARWRVSAIVTRPRDHNNRVDRRHADAPLQAGWSVVFDDASTVVWRREP